MSKKKRTLLLLSNGRTVNTFEELQAELNLADSYLIEKYYEEGVLQKWLADRYYEDVLVEISKLNKKSENFIIELYLIFGIDLTDTQIKNTETEQKIVQNSAISNSHVKQKNEVRDCTNKIDCQDNSDNTFVNLMQDESKNQNNLVKTSEKVQNVSSNNSQINTTRNKISQNIYPKIECKRSKKKKHKFRNTVIIVITLIVIAMVIVLNINLLSVDDVKNSEIHNYNITFGEAFDSYFENGSWKTFTNTSEIVDVVEFIGYDEKGKKYTIQFINDYEGITEYEGFDIYACWVDEETLYDEQFNELLDCIYHNIIWENRSGKIGTHKEPYEED